MDNIVILIALVLSMYFDQAPSFGNPPAIDRIAAERMAQSSDEAYRYPWRDATERVSGKVSGIHCPKGYLRKIKHKNSFGYWLSNLPLKPEGSQVLLYNGKPKTDQTSHFRVIDIDTGTRDLQQCADAVIRLRSEYLYAKKDFSGINFKFVNGFEAEFSKWIKGYRIQVSGNRCSWLKSGVEASGYDTFSAFLKTVFSYANTFSLSKQMKPVQSIHMIEAGDVFIRGGFPGHAAIVVDVAEDMSGKRVFLLAQSFMPAQDIHILNSPLPISPWYSSDLSGDLETPVWVFKQSELKRF